MPSIAEELKSAHRQGYLEGLHSILLRLTDDEGLPRPSSVVHREIREEIARLEGHSALPEAAARG